MSTHQGPGEPGSLQAVVHWGARLIRAAGRTSLFSRSARRRMVDGLRARGIHDSRVLAAMLEVPRELFVPEPLRDLAYEDRPLPISAAQTISQPYVVALMLQALSLEGTETVLEVGTGSGYGAALLSCLGKKTHSIERLPELATAAEARLTGLGYRVQVHRGDGTRGLTQHAPYGGIVVTASGAGVPPELEAQLALGGRLVIPVRERASEHLLAVHRLARTAFRRERLEEVRFVPLLGDYRPH